LDEVWENSKVINSLYSFASIGEPHEGVTTKEETELLLKTTTSILFYVNSLLKSERVRVMTKDIAHTTA
jgi:hypothetical protein